MMTNFPVQDTRVLVTTLFSIFSQFHILKYIPYSSHFFLNTMTISSNRFKYQTGKSKGRIGFRIQINFFRTF